MTKRYINDRLLAYYQGWKKPMVFIIKKFFGFMVFNGFYGLMVFRFSYMKLK